MPLPPTPGALKTIVCAAHDLDRTEKRDTALAALAAMSEMAPTEVFAAYVCAGEQAKAAEILGAMFKRPDLRTSAILTAQIYTDLARPGSDLDDKVNSNLLSLLESQATLVYQSRQESAVNPSRHIVTSWDG